MPVPNFSSVPTQPVVQGSSDVVCMAQLDLNTGAVLCANQSFSELTRLVGGGNQMLGLECLAGAFLEQIPRGLRYVHASIGVGPQAIELWSATQLLGMQGQEIVVWVIHRSMPPTASANMTSQIQPTTDPRKHTRIIPTEPTMHQMAPPFHSTFPRDVSAPQMVATQMPNRKIEPPESYPKAEEYTNLESKILCNDPLVSGRGRRQVQMLWRKYGERSLQNRKRKSGCSAFDRCYYKCTQKYCPAKLKVDLVPETGERLSITASGIHNHQIHLVESS